MGGLCKELPYGEYYVVLGCKPARGATEFGYAAQSGPPAFTAVQSCSVDVPEQDGVPHVKRWDGDPRPSVLVADEWRAKATKGSLRKSASPWNVMSELPRSALGATPSMQRPALRT